MGASPVNGSLPPTPTYECETPKVLTKKLSRCPSPKVKSSNVNVNIWDTLKDMVEGEESEDGELPDIDFEGVFPTSKPKVSNKAQHDQENLDKLLRDFVEKAKLALETRLQVEHEISSSSSGAAVFPKTQPENHATTPLVKNVFENEADKCVKNIEDHNCANTSVDVGPTVFALREGETIEEHLIRAVDCPKTSLMIHMVTIISNGLKLPLRVLIDTGCEMCLVRSGLIPSQYLRPAKNKMSLVAANGTILPGGHTECLLNLIAQGYDMQVGSYRFLELPTMCIEANINVDIILSFGWCVERHIDILAQKYGLKLNGPPTYFLGGNGNNCANDQTNVGKIEGQKPQLRKWFAN